MSTAWLRFSVISVMDLTDRSNRSSMNWLEEFDVNSVDRVEDLSFGTKVVISYTWAKKLKQLMGHETQVLADKIVDIHVQMKIEWFILHPNRQHSNICVLQVENLMGTGQKDQVSQELELRSKSKSDI